MTNFLPTHKRRKSGRGGKNLVCLIRNKTVISTPEEHVRQRVLHWLLEEKGWSKEFIRLEYSYPIVRKKGKYFVRPDIELLDEFQRVKIVIECKNEEETLDQRVMNQAKEYASKSGAHWIWMTNGENHIFLERQHFAEGHKRKAHWGRVSQIPILGVTFKPPKLEFNIPDDSNDKRELSKYIKNFPRDQHGGTSGLEIATDYLRRFIVDFHKLIFDQSQNDARLPYSFDGVHILEHRGRNFRFFSNASGGLWCGLYSDYLVATEGRVDTLSASILGWGGKASNELRLCVGVTKQERTHHALQMNVGKNINWDERGGYWNVWSDGRMNQVKSSTVMEAIKEEGLAHLVAECQNDKGRTIEGIYLGKLFPAKSATWARNKKFLANLFRYGLVRSNLRDAEAERKKRAKTSSR